nr:PREDICTED: calcium-binding protein 39-like [Lepisosteus oculatus]
MPFPFGKSQKSPAEIVRSLKENMAYLEKLDTSEGKKCEKVVEEVSKSLSQLKEVLCGTSDKEPQTEAVAQLAQELYNTNLLVALVANLQRIDFESFKRLWFLVVRRPPRCRRGRDPPALISRPPGCRYESPEVALNCGMMLRECLRHEPLARSVLYSEEFFCFFRYVELSTFDIASDAFASFKDLLTRHKIMCSDFLETNYDRVFTEYEKLLHSDNYVTKRQSLKLLGELLLDRHNFTVMTRYISRAENLKLMMNLLRDNSRNIQFEAFHVFKVFVANPNKTQPVMDILLKNQAKLVEFLSKFHTDRSEDEQFCDEKNYLIKQIRDLRRATPQET